MATKRERFLRLAPDPHEAAAVLRLVLAALLLAVAGTALFIAATGANP